MLPDLTTTRSGSATPGPSGAPGQPPGEIAGGPEVPAFVAINSVDWMQNRKWLLERRRSLMRAIAHDPQPHPFERGRRSARLDALLIINHALQQLELQRVA